MLDHPVKPVLADEVVGPARHDGEQLTDVIRFVIDA
jgi:hypothetical protein